MFLAKVLINQALFQLSNYKNFKNMIEREMCPLDWFYRFKIHIITNDKGLITGFMITKRNLDGRSLKNYIELSLK